MPMIRTAVTQPFLRPIPSEPALTPRFRTDGRPDRRCQLGTVHFLMMELGGMRWGMDGVKNHAEGVGDVDGDQKRLGFLVVGHPPCP